MAGWGGPRPNSGRKPGSKSKAVERRAIAAAVLSRIDEVAFWMELLTAERVLVIGSDGKYEKLTVPDYTTRADAAKFLTVQRDGRAFQQLNPAQRMPGDPADPKLAEVLRNLLPPAHSAEITVTEKQTRIDLNCDQNAPQSLQDAPGRTLESKAPIRKAKRLKAPSPAPTKPPVTIDAPTPSDSDPSGREKGVGHSGAESHTENIQVSGKSLETKE